MDKFYEIIIETDNGSILGAFTSMEAFERIGIKVKDYNICQGWWRKEWIMNDYGLNDFDIIKHD